MSQIYHAHLYGTRNHKYDWLQAYDALVNRLGKTSTPITVLFADSPEYRLTERV